MRSLVIFVLFVATLARASQGLTSDGGRRVLVDVKTPNVGPTDPYDFIDIMHARLFTWGTVSPAQMARFDNFSYDKIKQQTGIDPRSGTQIYPGFFVGPYWSVFAFEIGLSHQRNVVTIDTGNLNRGATGDWVIVKAGNLIAFTADGTVPGGDFAGYNFSAGGGFVQEIIGVYREGTDWTQPQNQDMWNCSSNALALQFFNGVDVDSLIESDCSYGADPEIFTATFLDTYRPDNGRTQLKTYVYRWPSKA